MEEPQSKAQIIVEVLGLILTVWWICLKELAFLVIPRPVKSLKEKTVVLTGAAQGIGRLVAEKIARLGARCVLVDIDRVSSFLTRVSTIFRVKPISSK